jgi:hypothetical protein
METTTELGAERRWRALRALTRRHAHALGLAAILSASLVFRVYVSSQCSLWLDEVLTHMDVMKSWPRVLAGAERVHPPLLFILVKLVYGLFGGSELSLRAVSLVSGCVLLVAVRWLCLELGLTKTRSLAIVALLAITPFFMRNAIEARHYALYPALATLATAATFRLLREPKRLRFLVAFAASASAMAATHYFGVAYAVALLGVLLVGLVPRWKELAFTPRQLLEISLLGLALLGVLAAMTLKALALARHYSTAQSGAVEDTVPWRQLLDGIVEEFAFVGDSPFVRVTEVALAVAGLVLLGRSVRGIARIVPAALGLVPCVLSLFIRSGHFVAPRYLAPSWVLYHVGACAALFAVCDRLSAALPKMHERLGPVVPWAVFAVPLGLRVAQYPTDYGAGLHYYRGLQRYFAEHLASDTRLVAFYGEFGERIMNTQYSVGRPPLRLDKFAPVPGVNRYLIAEFNATGERRQAELASLVQARFGLSPQAWRDLPLLDLPRTPFQPAVPAHLIEFDGKVAKAPRRHRHSPSRARPRHTEPRPED